MPKQNKVLISFGARNGKYQIGDGEVKELGYMDSIGITRNISSTSIFADNEEQDVLINEAGVPIGLNLSARDEEFETDLGYILKLGVGTGSPLVRTTKTVNICAEVYDKEKGEAAVLGKIWFLNCRVLPPNESYETIKENPTINTIEYPTTANGINMLSAEGDTEYIDPQTGDVVKVWRVKCKPSDAGYADFEKTVPVPTMTAAG